MMFAKGKAFNQVETTLCKVEETHSSWSNDSNDRPVFAKTDMGEFREPQDSYKQPCQHAQDNKPGRDKNNDSDYVVKQNDDYTHVSQSRKIRETPVQPLLDTRTKSQNSIGAAGRNNVDPKSLALPKSRNHAGKTKKPIKRGQEPQLWGDKIGLEIRLYIEYTDSKGSFTKRTVDVEWVTFDYLYSPIIFGYCHLRDDYRSFYIARISKCIDSRTGEVYIQIEGLLRERCETQSKTFEKLLEKNEAAFQILLYAGRKNGKLTLRKKNVIAAYLAPTNCTHKVSRRFIIERLKRIKPCAKSDHDFFLQQITTMSTSERKRLQSAIDEILLLR